MSRLHYQGPVVLAVMDGVGLSPLRSGNAVRQAHTEFLDYALTHYPNLPLAASGEAVGVMPGQMGNSEVGHNTLGSGQIIPQGIAQVEATFQSGTVWESRAWRDLVKYCQKHTAPTLHFCGIFSDGGVHSDIKYLEQMIARAYQEGIKRIRVHCVFDGRDVAPYSEPKYIRRLEQFFRRFPDADYRIATGGGRMVMTADRYGNDWPMVKLGWDAMVHGRAPHQFTSAEEAIRKLRQLQPKVQDQYLPAFVVVDPQGHPVGRIKSGDAVIYYDFRADRAVEIATAFTAKSFKHFDRGTVPEIYFAGLTEYDADHHIPKRTLVPSITIEQPLNTFLGAHGITQLAVSETVKFGHITYYFNGNSYELAPGEEHLEIPSDPHPFNTRPWMKSAEITDAILERLHEFQFIRLNFPGGDMVGHFAELEPTIVALEAIDLALRRLASAVDQAGGMLIITADHGNAEELLDRDGNPKTSHTTNPVPCIFYDNTKNARHYRLVAPSSRIASPTTTHPVTASRSTTSRSTAAPIPHPGLANLAATIATLLGQPDYPALWQPPLIQL